MVGQNFTGCDRTRSRGGTRREVIKGLDEVGEFGLEEDTVEGSR